MPKSTDLSYIVRVRDRVLSNTKGASIAQFEHARECDINFQIERFKGLGLNPFQPLTHDQCRDVSDLASDFIAANQVIQDARVAFDDIPENVQRRFNGSPAQFMEFMSDIHNNYDEAVKLGLVVPSQSPPPEPSPLAGKAADKPPAASAAQGSGA